MPSTTDSLHRAVSDPDRAVAGIAPPPADGRARASSQSTRPIVSRPPPSPLNNAASEGEHSDGEGSDVPESEPEVVAGLTNDGHSAPQHAVVITDISGTRLQFHHHPLYVDTFDADLPSGYVIPDFTAKLEAKLAGFETSSTADIANAVQTILAEGV